jgi:hypothetical protein
MAVAILSACEASGEQSLRWETKTGGNFFAAPELLCPAPARCGVFQSWLHWEPQP